MTNTDSVLTMYRNLIKSGVDPITVRSLVQSHIDQLEALDKGYTPTVKDTNLSSITEAVSSLKAYLTELNL